MMIVIVLYGSKVSLRAIKCQPSGPDGNEDPVHAGETTVTVIIDSTVRSLGRACWSKLRRD